MNNFYPFTRLMLSSGKALRILFFLMLFATGATAQPSIQWQKTFGGSEYEEANIIRQTKDGGYIVAGRADSGDGDVGPTQHGSLDCWILKLNEQGDVEWKKVLGGTGSESISAIEQTSDGGFIVAATSDSNDGDVTGGHGMQDIWVIKLDESGNIEWDKVIGGTRVETCQSILQTGDGGYIMAGQSNSPEITGQQVSNWAMDVHFLRLAPDGALLWQKTLGGSSNDYGFEIKKSSSGGYIILGATSSQDGDVEGPYFGLWDCWLIKIDDSGELEWQKTFGGNHNDYGRAIQQTPDGGYIITGDSRSYLDAFSGNHGFSDCWTMKISATGVLEWQKILGGNSIDVGQSVILTSDGGYLVWGATYSNNGDVAGLNGEIDGWLLKLNATGDLQWQKPFGGSKRDAGNSVQQTGDNGYILAGYSYSSDGDVDENKGVADFWVIKLGAESVGVEDVYSSFLEGQLEISPNPSNQFISLKIASEDPFMSVRIVDLAGRLISNQTIPNGGSIDISQLPDGLYSVSAATPAGALYANKFRKQH